METGNYNALIIKACQKVKKNKFLNVSLDVSGCKFCGIHKYSQENIYKVPVNFEGKILNIYVEEYAFESWANVPWSGRTDFRPADWDNWPADQKLMIAWCWCIYNYCKDWQVKRREPAGPLLEV